MAKPSSRGASKTSSESRQSNLGSGMLLTGFVLGVVATLGGQWLLRSGFDGDTDPIAAVATDSSETDFEFYTLLEDIEVEVAEANAVSAEDDDIIYWLQVSSHRDPAAAEETRVSLILQNMEVEVKPFSHEGTLWHRVMAGPFQTAREMNKARQTLVGMGESPLLLTEDLGE